MTLPVMLLRSPGDDDACLRTLDSLATQTVLVEVCSDFSALDAADRPYAVFVLAGVVLDVTACERAVWLLHTHPHLTCVTGAQRGTAGRIAAIASATQFLVVRTVLAKRLLGSGDVADASTAIALLLGARMESQRVAGWLSDPAILAACDAALLARIESDARGALAQLGVAPEALVAAVDQDPPRLPIQELAHPVVPPITVRDRECAGMRLLVLLQGFPMGGYTAFNADLLPRLADAGHDVTICTTEWWRSDWRLEVVRASAPDIHHAAAVVPYDTVVAYIDWLVTTRRIQTVLLSHSHLAFHALPWLRARHPRVAFVDYTHTDWFEREMYGSYATMSARWAGQLDAQLVTSQALVEQLVSRGCDRGPLCAAHIGVDTQLWHNPGPRLAELRESFGATEDTTILVFAGRLSREKRPHLAVDVAAALVREGHDVRILFAGSGPLLEATHARAQASGLASRCSFLGELDEHTLRHVYAASDVLIATSEIEGIARTLYEGMAMGCVPVVSDVGGQRELVVPGTGSLVDARLDDAQRYTDATRQWCDPQSRRAASSAARAHIVAHFDVRRTVGIVSEVLQSALVRRQDRQATLPATMAEELAVQALEITRRHVVRP